MPILIIGHVFYDKYALASSNVQRHCDLIGRGSFVIGAGLAAPSRQHSREPGKATKTLRNDRAESFGAAPWRRSRPSW
jgi:hypothetical protein